MDGNDNRCGDHDKFVEDAECGADFPKCLRVFACIEETKGREKCVEEVWDEVECVAEEAHDLRFERVEACLRCRTMEKVDFKCCEFCGGLCGGFYLFDSEFF